MAKNQDSLVSYLSQVHNTQVPFIIPASIHHDKCHAKLKMQPPVRWLTIQGKDGQHEGHLGAEVLKERFDFISDRHRLQNGTFLLLSGGFFSRWVSNTSK